MIEDFYKYSPYELDKEQKNELLTNELISLTKAHAERISLKLLILMKAKLTEWKIFLFIQ